jgi:predicted membrane channel-forming protein YqfA (hemolysin III family)
MVLERLGIVTSILPILTSTITTGKASHYIENVRKRSSKLYSFPLEEEHQQPSQRMILADPKNFVSVGPLTLFSPPLLTIADSLPPHMSHRFIESGYRTPVANISLVTQQSFFTIHNETGEVYTSLLSALVFVQTWIMAWSVLNQCDKSPFAKAGFFALFSTEVLAHFVSCITHAYWTHSTKMHRILCRLDYLMIFTSGYGKAVCLYSLHIARDFSILQWCVLITFLGMPFAACILLTWRPWVSQQHRAMLVGFTVLLIVYPLYRIHQLPLYISRPLFTYWALYLLTLAIGGLLYVTRLPERKWRGFDMIGHSHQLWHIAAFVANYFAFCALWEMHRLI